MVAGSFDPLTADNATDLARIKGSEPHSRLGVFVLDLPDPHLSSDARSALVAALRCVDLVGHGEPDSLPEESSRIRIVYNPDQDQRHSDCFVQLVLRRQKVGS